MTKGFLQNIQDAIEAEIKPLIPVLLVLTEQISGSTGYGMFDMQEAQLILIIISQDINLLNWL